MFKVLILFLLYVYFLFYYIILLFSGCLLQTLIPSHVLLTGIDFHSLSLLFYNCFHVHSISLCLLSKFMDLKNIALHQRCFINKVYI